MKRKHGLLESQRGGWSGGVVRYYKKKTVLKTWWKMYSTVSNLGREVDYQQCLGIMGCAEQVQGKAGQALGWTKGKYGTVTSWAWKQTRASIARLTEYRWGWEKGTWWDQKSVTADSDVLRTSSTTKLTGLMSNTTSCLPPKSFLLPKQWMTWGNGTAWVRYHINAWQLQDREMKITARCAWEGHGEYFWLCSQDPCPLHCSHWVEMCMGRGQSSSVQKLLEIAFPGFISYPMPGQFPNPLLWGHLSFFPATAWDHRTFPAGQVMVLVSWPEIFVETVKLPPPIPAVGWCGGWEEWWFVRHHGLGSGFSEVESWILPSAASQRRCFIQDVCACCLLALFALLQGIWRSDPSTCMYAYASNTFSFANRRCDVTTKAVFVSMV